MSVQASKPQPKSNHYNHNNEKMQSCKININTFTWSVRPYPEM